MDIPTGLGSGPQCTNDFDTLSPSLPPPSSPDLNPMDYGIWALLKARLGRRRFKGVRELKKALKRAWRSITVEECRNIVGSFRRRLETLIAAGGSNFEHLL